MSKPQALQSFAERVVAWQSVNGRHSLPWQQQRTRYRVWVSEVMLQQTQVSTVIPYFEAFMQRFPSVVALASAPEDDVLSLWAGLGYYSRARNLHKAACQVVAMGLDDMPATAQALEALPGIGRSTAAAIVSLADNICAPILDGNVKRVMARHATVAGWPGQARVLKQLWQVAEQRMPDEAARAYNQGLMDLGSLICLRQKPLCDNCPVSEDCLAKLNNQIADYPGNKPKKQRPHKTAYFLLLTDQSGALALQKRPPTGIWGGLWSLPQFDSYDLMVAGAAKKSRSVELTALATIEHQFSHYRLTLNPYHMQLRGAPDFAVEEPSLRFIEASRLAAYGQPAPIKKLIAAFYEQQKGMNNGAHD